MESLSIPPPPHLQIDLDAPRVRVNEPESDSEEVKKKDQGFDMKSLDLATDMPTLVKVLNKRIEQIKKKYEALREKLDKDEKNEIEEFYAAVHAKMRSSGNSCPIL